MNIETFKICCRAMYPNCTFKKAGILVDAYVPRDDGLERIVATFSRPHKEGCLYLNKEYYFFRKCDDLVKLMRISNGKENRNQP